MLLAVGRHQGYAEFDRSTRCEIGELAAPVRQTYEPVRVLAVAEQQVGKILATASKQAGDPEDLTGSQFKTDAVDAAAADVPNGQRDFTCRLAGTPEPRVVAASIVLRSRR